MNLYEIEILDIKAGVAKRVEAFVGWTQYSPLIYRTTMCDCNLGGCRDREIRTQDDGQRLIQAHEGAAWIWRKNHGGCDHTMPPTRMKALKAYLRDGRVYDFETGQFMEAAA